MLPKNDGEIYRLWAGGDRWGWKFCHINKKVLVTDTYAAPPAAKKMHESLY